METVIELVNVKKNFPGVSVLKGVSLKAFKGQVTALIGPSGSGKSTLLRCINLLENSDEGEIIFKGNPIRWKGIGVRRSPKDKKQVLEVRTKLSMVFQQFNLWSHLSILQNVVEAPVTVLRWNKKDVEESALDLLEKVGILEKKDAYPNQLSGGQQQRAAIARALCMKPEALLLDEPTSALDPELEKEVISVIKDLAREGTTMIIVTHDMQLARDIADQVIFLHMGKIEESGNPDRIFSRPTSERLKRFLAS
tara:strand:- start:215 stop:970 length:756 start_codon:yes stop_codon:yes gene_type:complete